MLVRIIQLAFGLVIAAAGLLLFLKDVDITQLRAGLQSFSPGALIVCCLLVLLTLYLRAVRWGLMLPCVAGAHKRRLFSNVVVGFMVNNIMPARLGEAARALILWRNNAFSPTVAVGSLVIERVLDLIVYLSFMVIPAFILPQCRIVMPFAMIAIAAIAGCIACFAVYGVSAGAAARVARRVAMLAPKRMQLRLFEIGGDLASTLGWLRQVGRMSAVVLLSVLVGMCYPAMLMVLSSGPNALGLPGSMFAQAFAAFGAAIPLAPGYVGTLHAVMLQGLTILGMEADRARATVILYHAVNYIPITVLGLFFFFRLRLSFGDISRAKKEMGQ